MYKIARYVISGVLATSANLFVTYALTDFLGIWYVLSSVVGFFVALSISFTLQRFWTFQHSGLARMHIEAVQFISVALGGLMFNAASVFILVEYAHVHYLFAQFTIGLFIAIGNFVFYHIIFRGAARRSLKMLWHEELGEWERALIIAGGVAAFLVALKLLGVGLPYHQDEWKVARFVVDPASMAGIFHHPPLTELLFRLAGWLFPPELLRLVPLVFTAASYGILYLVVERRAGFKATLLAVILSGTVAYGTLAALMLDTDGVVLPFFMLCAVYAYDRWRESTGKIRILFGGLLLVALVLGFLVKLSFVIVLCAILRLSIQPPARHQLRDVWRPSSVLVLFLALMALLIAAARFVNPVSAQALCWGTRFPMCAASTALGATCSAAVKALMYMGLSSLR